MESQIDRGIIERVLNGLMDNSNTECMLPSYNDVIYVYNHARAILRQENNVLHITPPVLIVGNLHGQFESLKDIWSRLGSPATKKYLFLGNYVNRGNRGYQLFICMMCMKILYSSSIYILRGNHESGSLIQVYGYSEQIERLDMYSKAQQQELVESAVLTFDTLPLVCIINDKIICVHGGISPKLCTIRDILEIDRYKDVPHEGIFCDILWSDPDHDIEGFAESPRGAGFLFGKDVLEGVLLANGLDRMYRSNTLHQDGFERMFDGKLANIWSAPNYCGRIGNRGVVLELNEQLQETIHTFEPK